MEALGEYARTPVCFTPVKSDLLLRLLIADLVGQQVTRESIATLREAIADLQARIAGTEAAAESLPHRRKYLLLVTGHLRRLSSFISSSSTKWNVNLPANADWPGRGFP